MTTQNNEQLILKKLEALEHSADKLAHGQTLLYWINGGMLAFLLFVAGLMFFTWGDVKEHGASITNIQAQVQTLENKK